MLPFSFLNSRKPSTSTAYKLCIMYYDGFLIYASTQEILCKSIKKLRLKAPTDILEPKEGEILKIDRTGRITTGAFAPRTSYEHW